MLDSPLSKKELTSTTREIFRHHIIRCDLPHATPLEEAYRIIHQQCKDRLAREYYPGMEHLGDSGCRLGASLLANDIVFNVCGDDGQGGLSINSRQWRQHHSLAEVSRVLRRAKRPLFMDTELYSLMPQQYQKRFTGKGLKDLIQSHQESRPMSDPDYIFSVSKGRGMLFEQALISDEEAHEVATEVQALLKSSPDRQYHDLELASILKERGLFPRKYYTPPGQEPNAWSGHIVSLCLWHTNLTHTRYLGRYVWQYGLWDKQINSGDRLTVAELIDEFFRQNRRAATREELEQHVFNVRGAGYDILYTSGGKLQRLSKTLLWSPRVSPVQPDTATFGKISRAVVKYLTGKEGTNVAKIKARLSKSHSEVQQMTDWEFCALVCLIEGVDTQVEGTAFDWEAVSTLN